LRTAPVHIRVPQKVVPALVRSPPHAEERKSALVRSALRKSASLSVEERRFAPHKLARWKSASFMFEEEKLVPTSVASRNNVPTIFEDERVSPEKSASLKLQPFRLELGPGLEQSAASALISTGASDAAGSACRAVALSRRFSRLRPRPLPACCWRDPVPCFPLAPAPIAAAPSAPASSALSAARREPGAPSNRIQRSNESWSTVFSFARPFRRSEFHQVRHVLHPGAVKTQNRTRPPRVTTACKSPVLAPMVSPRVGLGFCPGGGAPRVQHERQCAAGQAHGTFPRLNGMAPNHRISSSHDGSS
jgi:hypothetical protein